MLCSCGGSETDGELTVTATVTAAPVTSASETQTSASETVTEKSVTETQTVSETQTVTETETQTVTYESSMPETEKPADTHTVTETQTQKQTEKATEAPAGELTAEKALSMLSLREKVCQVFMLRFDGLLFNDNSDHAVRYMTDYFKRCVANYPIGGYIAMGDNLVNAAQITALNRDVSALYTVKPFLCTDEEGGLVSRIANNKGFDVPTFPNMNSIAASGDTNKAYELGSTISGYLKEYGFNLDLAPVADVNTNPLNIVIGARAFGSDPAKASGFVSAAVDGLHSGGIMSCLKHFPGHGDTAEDTHYMTAAVNKTWEQMKSCELIPFIGSLDKTDMVMAAHIIAPQVTGDDTPASLSYTLLTEKLRKELGFDGVIITDALAMKAVSKLYSPEQSCIESFKSGADILLAPEKPYQCIEAMIAAVNSGEISTDRLDESVLRILKLKEKYGMLG